jgi:hypothetical protein
LEYLAKSRIARDDSGRYAWLRFPRLALALLAYVVIYPGDETLTVSAYLQLWAYLPEVLPSGNASA